MSTKTVSIEQQATIASVNGNVQLIREGFFLPAQIGMVLLPGDRVTSDIAAKAVIQFTGVADTLVIENGAAATFHLELVDLEQPPQWIATDLFGEGVYFDRLAVVEKTVSNGEATPDMFGLFHTTGGDSDSTGYPVLETIAGLVATAAIYSDSENNSSTNANDTSNMSNASESSGPPPPPATSGTNNEQPNPSPETNGPLDALLNPISTTLESLLGLSETTAPINASQSNIVSFVEPATFLDQSGLN